MDVTPASSTASDASELASILGVQTAPAQPAMPSSPSATPDLNSNDIVRINGQDMPIAVVETLVELGQSAYEVKQEADAALQLSEDASKLAEMLRTFSVDEVNLVLDQVEAVLQAREEGRTIAPGTPAIQEFKAPPNYQRMRTEEMTDEGATNAEDVVTLERFMKRQFRQIAGAIKTLQDYVGSVAAISQDEQTARECSRLLGYPVSVELVEEWRANGIADPLKAIPFLKAQGNPQARQQQTPGRTPPPSAPPSTGRQTFDANDPYYQNPAHVMEAVERGIWPADKADRDLLAQSLGVKPPF